MFLMAGKYTNLLALLAVATLAHSWELPNLPSGRRTQYFILHDDGGYKYGYDTGVDHFGKQAGDSNNEVSGHYVYKAANGQDVDIKYTAGVNGFIPEGLEKLAQQSADSYAAAHSYHAYPAPNSAYEYSTSAQATPSQHVPLQATTYASSHSGQYTPYSGNPSGAVSNDGSYKFEYSTGDQSRQESSDPAGNVQGKYSFTNEAGTHDLSYVAGSKTGFQPTGGSLSLPNGLAGKTVPSTYSSGSSSASTGYHYNPAVTGPVSSYHAPVPNTDGSYSFEYSTGDQSRQESSDPAGNVQGKYSFTNEAGTHDLSYVAGSQTGFQPTGGSLSLPNGLTGKAVPSTYSSAGSSASTGYHYNPAVTGPVSSYHAPVPNTDGSYSFEYSTGDQSRQESSDPAGNVQGKYSFTNEAGTHDLSYVAGSSTGFQATGGSLSVPNGLAGKVVPATYSSSGSSDSSGSGYQYNPPVTTYSADSEDDQANTGDSSYSFTIDTDEYKRQESSDPQGNVKGSYSYKNNAGVHDLSFVAGSETGFLPTGGSLSVPNGVNEKATSYGSAESSGSSGSSGYHYKPPVTSYSNNNEDESNSGDSSYSFTIDTDDYKRQESSDPQGNVKGTYSYKNNAGVHDLSFVAGSETGFLPTGGSLATANGLEGKNIPHADSVLSRSGIPSHDDEQSSGDASYSFSIDTDDYTRKESADSAGNVKGTYSYKNIAGTHDLSYNAGANTGFVPVSGSLSAPNGLSGPYAAPDYIPPQVRMSDFAKTKAEFAYTHGKVGNVFLKQYYPSKSQSKYGYIFESA